MGEIRWEILLISLITLHSGRSVLVPPLALNMFDTESRNCLIQTDSHLALDLPTGFQFTVYHIF